MKRPIRVAQHLASEQNHIRLSAVDDLVGLSGFGNHAHSARKYAGIAANAFGKRHLIAGANGNFCGGDVASRGAIDKIDAKRTQVSRQFHGLLNIPAAFDPVCRRDTNKQGQAFGPNAADALRHLSNNSCAVLE